MASCPSTRLVPARPLQPQRRRLLLAGGSSLALLLAGCGFHLRGQQALPFATLHVNVAEHSSLGTGLRRLIPTATSTRLVSDPAQADARLQILNDHRGREILSLTGAGKVREYQLVHTLRFQLLDRQGNALIAPSQLSVSREYTFDDSQVLGKEQEEALLFEDMEQDLLLQLMRRMARINPSAAAAAAAQEP